MLGFFGAALLYLPSLSRYLDISKKKEAPVGAPLHY